MPHFGGAPFREPKTFDGDVFGEPEMGSSVNGAGTTFTYPRLNTHRPVEDLTKQRERIVCRHGVEVTGTTW